MCDKAPYLPTLAASDHRLPKSAESAENVERGREGKAERARNPPNVGAVGQAIRRADRWRFEAIWSDLSKEVVIVWQGFSARQALSPATGSTLQAASDHSGILLLNP